MDLGMVVWQIFLEHRIARWLPPWRRYISAIPWVIDAAFIRHSHGPWIWWATPVVCVLLVGWNCYTASRNRIAEIDRRLYDIARAIGMTDQDLATLFPKGRP